MSVTLEEFARHLNRTVPAAGSPDHDELQLHLDAGTNVVAARCGAIVNGDRTFRVRASGKNLVVPATHLRQVTAVRDPHGTVVEYDADATNLAAGVIAVHAATAGLWEVDANLGPDTVPADLRLAVYIIAEHLWKTQRGAAARPGVLGPDDSMPVGFAIPRRAAELMAPYTLPGMA